MTRLKQLITDNKTKVNWALVTTAVLVLLALFAVGVGRYGWGWTGFLSYPTPKSDTEAIQPGKTLWDLIELLIIPVVLVVGGFLLNRAQRQNELDIARAERKTKRQIAKDREAERALQSYLETMTELLFERNLHNSEEAHSVVRPRTLTVLRSLDGERKGNILRFLYETKLIGKDNTVIELRGANLGRVNLEEANLGNANLSETDLRGANLREAKLWGANLTEAKLEEANLGKANLRDADLGGANLRAANLRAANLRAAKLEEANLGNANLRGADLGGANLRGANLRGANLEDANLREADLRGADLRGANLKLRGANLWGANLEEVKYNNATAWPRVFNPEQVGAKEVGEDAETN
jgi:uncharacterized protein YjbI with pentapeptide repeats